MALPFDRNACPSFMIRVFGPIIAPRTLISPSDGESARCSGSSPLDSRNASSQSKPPSRTSSPSNAIFCLAPFSSSFARGRFLYGGRAAFLPDCGQRGVRSTAVVNVSMPPCGMNGCPLFMIKGCELAIGHRMRTNPSGGESGSNSGSNHLDLRNAFSLCTPLSRKPSKSNAISSHVPSSINSGRRHSKSGGSALRQPDRCNGQAPRVPRC